MNQFRAFVIGIAIGGGVSAGTIAAAASGDLIYTDTQVTQLTNPQAACFATCAVNAGAWDGAVADADRLVINRRTDGTFHATVSGTKADSPTDLATLHQSTGRSFNVVGFVE